MNQRTFNRVIKPLVYTLAFIAGITCAYGLFMFSKFISYQVSYNSHVERTICDTVKPEYIVDDKCED